MTNNTSLITRLVRMTTSKHEAWKYRISLFLEGNGLDTYIGREAPIPEGDEAKSLTQEEIGKGREDHC